MAMTMLRTNVFFNNAKLALAATALLATIMNIIEMKPEDLMTP
jgi:hypothetical protein